MTRFGHPSSAGLALIIAAVTVGTLSTAFALGHDEAVVVRPQVAAAEVAGTGEAPCGEACSSHVIASPNPGGPAIVVTGASAFGLAIDGGAAIGDHREDRVLPTIPGAQATATVGVTVGPSGAFRGEPEPRRTSGGLAFADASAAIDHRLSGL